VRPLPSCPRSFGSSLRLPLIALDEGSGDCVCDVTPTVAISLNEGNHEF